MTPRPPGIHDLSVIDYLTDTDALSSTGARRLLPPSCPAAFRYWQTHPEIPTDAFDFGQGAHRTLLGVGPDITYIDADDWRRKDTIAKRDHARAEGFVPLLRKDEGRLEAMVAALRAHPIAGPLLAPDSGHPEQSLYATDSKTGIMRRGRLDWLPHPQPDRRMLIVDYKTAFNASPDVFDRAVFNHGYYMQAAWYVDLVKDLGLHDDPGFLFVVQEKDPPHLVSVVQLDGDAMRTGRERNRYALDTYAKCVADDDWPGYADDVVLVSLPGWAAA